MAANNIDLIIAGQVTGLNQIKNLDKTLGNIANKQKQLGTAGPTDTQIRKAIMTTQKQNDGMKNLAGSSAEARIEHGKLLNSNRELKTSTESFNEVNMESARIKKSGLRSDATVVAIAERRIQQKKQEAIDTAALNERLAEEARQRGRVRAELMQMSIGLFVLGITMGQTLSTMADMVGKNTTLGKTFTGLAGAVKMMLGPIQVYTALMQLAAIENKKMLMTSLPLMIGFGGFFLLLKAFQEESPGVRAAMGAIGGAMLAMSVASGIKAKAQWAEGISSVFKWVAGAGPAAPAMAAMLGIALAGAVAGAIALSATAPKGQTVPGYMRPIKETGLFYGHRGEVVGRIGGMSPTGGGGVNISINIESGAVVDEPLITTMAKQIELAVASGQGV